MFRSSQFLENINDIPTEWIFENYLDLPEKLNGQKVNIRSIFNPTDSTPSMYLYYANTLGKYFFDCYSSGNKGGAVDLMMTIWGLPFRETQSKIKEDYLEYRKTGKYNEDKTTDAISEYAEWKVTSHVERGWFKEDGIYWMDFGIGSSSLLYHQVRAIESYVMTKFNHKGEAVDSFTISPSHVYGYFNKAGELCKLYQPKNKRRKFIKIRNYIQGSDQLQGHPVLMITSSLKDIMTIKGLGLRLDILAPDSENVMFSQVEIDDFRKRYKAIVVYLDSDPAGVRGMQSYRDKYGLPLIYIHKEKDISDVRKIHGKEVALRELYPKLQAAIDKYALVFLTSFVKN